jgi:phytoene synthase
MGDAIRNAYAHCEALVRDADKTRFLASLFAPAARRPHLHALHAFNVEIVRVRHLVHEVLAGEIRLQWWRDALAGEARGEVTANPVAAALLDTMARCNLPWTPLAALIDAHAQMLYDEPIATLADLEAVMRATASSLFGLAAHILDRNAALAVVADPAGVAYGLADLLQGFARDAARGRMLLPLDLLERHGLRRDDVIGATPGGRLKPALAEIIAIAQVRLAEAKREWSHIPVAARPAFLPLALVEPVLARVARNADPFRPVDLALWRRQWALWRAARRGSP